MRTVNSPVGSTPMPVSRSRSALRIISPAPASRISASAICAVTSTPRASSQRAPPSAFPFFSASTGRRSDACAAGSSDTSMAVSSATPPVNTTVIASRPIIDAPMRVSPDAPAILGVPGATAERKNTSGSGMTAAAAAEQREGDEQPGGRAEHRQHDPLGDELPHDPSAAGANRDADGDLAAAGHRLGSDEIRQIHARDQQHEADRAEQHQRRAPNVGIDARRVHGVGARRPSRHRRCPCARCAAST